MGINLFKKKQQQQQQQQSPPGVGVGVGVAPSSSSQEEASASSSSTAATATASAPPPFSSASSLSSSLSDQYSTQQHHQHQHQQQPQELIPILTLLKCHASRIYLTGVEAHLTSETRDTGIDYSVMDLTLKGSNLTLFREEQQHHVKPVVINIVDVEIHLEASQSQSQSQGRHVIVLVSQQSRHQQHTHRLKFTHLADWQRALAAIKLAQYEYTRLNEAYTASLLSSKATAFSDLHVVLAENRYVYEEQCSVKLHGEWRNALCVVTPVERRLVGGVVGGVVGGGAGHRHDGSMKFYLGSKPARKNLLCSVENVKNCFAVFTHVGLIDESSIIQLNGDVKLYDEVAEEATHTTTPTTPTTADTTAESPSTTTAAATGMGRLRSNSTKSHRRGRSSISSMSSLMSSSKQQSEKALLLHKNASLYIIPRRHHSVKSFETLIRFLIPIYDAFQLYGRPVKLAAERSNRDSLLFGLPSLPRSRILTPAIANDVVVAHWRDISLLEDHADPASARSSVDRFDFAKLFNETVERLYGEDPAHRGFGNLRVDMQQEAAYLDPVVVYNTPDTAALEIHHHRHQARESDDDDGDGDAAQVGVGAQVEGIAAGHYKLNALGEAC